MFFAILAISIGAAIGALARWGLTLWLGVGAMPWGTPHISDSLTKERKLNKMTKSFPYRSFKLTMQFRILFHRQP